MRLEVGGRAPHGGQALLLLRAAGIPEVLPPLRQERAPLQPLARGQGEDARNLHCWPESAPVVGVWEGGQLTAGTGTALP